MFIDSHTHLFYPDFNDDREEVIRRAIDAGVKYFVVPGTNLETSREAIQLAERYGSVYACVGVHPLDCSSVTEAGLQEVEALTSHPKVVAVGEIGLDYYYDASNAGLQRELFKRQLEIAVRKDLPIVIHTRNAMDDAIRIVEEYVAAHPQWRRQFAIPNSRLPVWKGVFHCFSGDAATAYRLLHSGFIVSFPGIVTFKKNSAFDTVATFGYDHIMVETDAPFLAPVPHRGKRNEPSNIPVIAQKIAEACHASIDDVARTTSFNAKKLFRIGEPEPPVFTYKLGDALYLNLTIRCDADCVFCDRKGEAVVKGYNLKITREPSVREIIEEIHDPTRYSEIVFCGYGEPTIRFDAVKEIAAWVKSKGGRTRLNTDGHGNIINKRNIAPELRGILDSVSISLNSADPEEYGRLMRLNGKKHHQATVDFGREAKRFVPEVVMTVVGMDEVEVEKAKKFAEEEIGVPCRVRQYF
ncbi:MAG: YchF/TatD family DNA exonuclease [Bacteroidota bacterium]|nr:YchF/TatD family DNA exonuclease [Bacteroidota bacterium]